MKKIKLLVFALIALGAVAMVSCVGAHTKSDDSSGQSDDKDEQINEVKYLIPNLYELLDIATVTVCYTDAKGNEQEEVLKEPSWSKVIEGIKAPYTASIRLKAERNDVELTKTSYKLDRGYAVLYKLESQSVWSGSVSASYLSISANKVEEYIAKINATDPKTHKFE